jgi:hypothetical protein
MVRFLLPVLLLLSLSTFSQDKLIKYYDSLWAPTSKDSAFYYTEFIKQGTLYNCTSYWAESNKLNCKSIYADTLFTKPRGLLLRYYESGQVQDSSYFYESGEIRSTYHFYPNGKIWAHSSYDKRTKKSTSEGFDQEGKKINDFVYMKEAEFPGGNEGWNAFVIQNFNAKVPIRNRAPVGVYKIIISFVVSETGKVIDIKPQTNFGYGMEEEAMRVIRKSPRWSPLILLGEAKKAFRIQPFSFAVTEEKR